MGKCDDLRNDTNAMNALSRLFATFRAPGSHERATHHTRRRHLRRPSRLIAGEALEPKQLMAIDVVNAFADQSLSTSAPVTIAITNQFDLTDVIGTVAKFETNAPLGGTDNLTSNDFYVELYDKAGAAGTITSGTVANFLSYVNDGSYDNSKIHRSVSDFVIQGGGFTAPSLPADQPGSDPVAIATKGTITNEPGNSNLRGTIAMAKLGGQPNSATSQWFVNLSDNTFLDTDNGGYAVFGEVLGDGMTVVDVMGTALTYDATTYYSNSAFSDLPLWGVNADNIVLPQDFVKIETITTLTDESELMTYSVTTSDSGKLAASINAAGDLVLTPVAGQTGSVSVTVTATSKTDGETASDTFAVGLGGGGTTDPEEPTLTAVESAGSVTLNRDGTGKLYAGTVPILAGSSHITASTFSGFTVRAAEVVSGTNQVLLERDNGSLLVWTLNSDWHYLDFTQSTTHDPGSAGFYAAELAFGIDVDGGGPGEAPLSPLEQSGSVILNESSTNGLLYANTTPIYAGSLHIKANSFDRYTVRAAETDGLDNKVLLEGSDGSLLVWTLNADWQYVDFTQSVTHKPGSSGFYQTETLFSLDIDGGGIGQAPLSPIEQAGSVTLNQNSVNGLLYAGTTAIYAGSLHVKEDSFGGFTITAAETDGSDNKVLLTGNDGSLVVWTLNTDWQFVDFTQSVKHKPGSNGFYQNETLFGIDVDGGGIGQAPLSPVEQIGAVTLNRNTVNNLLYAGTTPIYAGSLHITPTSFSGFTVVGAETQASVNKVLLTSARGLTVWTLNADWQFNDFTQSVTHKPGSADFYETETLFGIDVDGGGVGAAPLSAVEEAGSVPLNRNTVNGLLYAGTTAIIAGSLHVKSDSFTGYTVTAVETDGSINKALLVASNGSALVWTLTSSWQLDSSASVRHAVGSPGFYAAEILFGHDIDGGGVGQAAVTDFETDGLVSVQQDSDGFLYVAGNRVRVGSLDVKADNITGYRVVGAEVVEGVNQILLKRNSDNRFVAWECDSSWARTGEAGQYAVGTATYATAEATFVVDGNDDGIRGEATVIDSTGVVMLSDTSGLIYVASYQVRVGSFEVGVTNLTGFQILAAETIDDTNQILLKRLSDNRLIVWSCDASWSRTGELTQTAAGDQAYYGLETAFAVDADGGGIGISGS